MLRATRCSRWAMVATATFFSAGALAAQAEPTPPPAVLQVSIESVRSGRGGSHAALEQEWAQTFRQSGVPVYWLGATTETGPNEAWYFTGIGGFADLESMDKAVESSPGLGEASDMLARADEENVSETRSFIARYRGDLSKPGATPVANGRYFGITMFRVRPGHETDFMDAAKLYGTVVADAKSSDNWAVYQVVSGMPTPTFLVFTLMKSLSEMDPGADAAAMDKAMTADRQKKFSDLASSGIISTTNIILRLAPRMSTMPKEFTDLDPSFWNVGR
jgi:hypothetical protein